MRSAAAARHASAVGDAVGWNSALRKKKNTTSNPVILNSPVSVLQDGTSWEDTDRPNVVFFFFVFNMSERRQFTSRTMLEMFLYEEPC